MRGFNKKHWKLSLALVVIMLTLAVVAIARNESNPVTYSDHQRFRSDVTISSPTAARESTVTIGPNANTVVSGDLTISSDPIFSGNATFNQAVINKAYHHASTSGALTWAYAYGNVLLLSGTTPITVTLPAITEAMDGYILTIKNVSGSTTRTINPAALVDAIEATSGTLTGSTDTGITTAGYFSTYVAVYLDTFLSGTSSVWMLLSEKVA